MIFALAAVSVALIAVLLVGYRRERALIDELGNVRRDAASERSELLERIQRPERQPVAFQRDYPIPDREPDEWDKVGTVTIDPKYGFDDEEAVTDG